ncbi:hypothetical protein TWF481_008721 [Arthrobotrys musiformis]|uniref:Uncharacterized protein n=1 Tax=Arthrobotrys musiformis TaxID=47236 RepID=A0AAV9W9W8_9PEZI
MGELPSTGKASKLVFLACVFKLIVTIPTWAQQAKKTSFFEFLALANSTLTDWMLFIVATYVLLHYLGGHSTSCTHHVRKKRSHTSNASVSSPTSRSSKNSRSSTRSSGSNISMRSYSTHTSDSSTATSVIDRRTSISVPMEQFLRGRNEYFDTARGMVEGSFGELGGSGAWRLSVEHGGLFQSVSEHGLE